MNKTLQTKSVKCTKCKKTHNLSQCAQKQVVIPATSWPDNVGTTNIEFTCPNCDDIIYTHKVR